MANSVNEIPLPQSVEQLVQRICAEQSQPPPDPVARRHLSLIGEQPSLDILKKISNSRIKTLSGFIVYMAKKYQTMTAGSTTTETSAAPTLSPQKRSSPCSPSTYTSLDDYSYGSPSLKHFIRSPSSSPNKSTSTQNHFYKHPESACTRTPSISRQLLVLSGLEFRKLFLVLCYTGGSRLEDAISLEDSHNILEYKNQPMHIFEEHIWSLYGKNCCCDGSVRRKYLDWDSRKTHVYYCYVNPDGSFNFKGPYLDTTKTHLQRELGDDNVLIVKFVDKSVDGTDLPSGSINRNMVYSKIAKEGILVGLKRYHFFVFKDGGKQEKKKSPTSSAVKCYFVRMDSIAPYDENESYILSRKTVYQARCLFMHVHMVSSMAKYMARFSLILSKTIKLQVDFTSVHVETIEDILCHDKNDLVVCNDGEPLIHTDGTGFISEDLAMNCPKDFYNLKFEEKTLEPRGTETRSGDPPLLMQCRLFYNGCAVKGTFLVNKKLPPGTIQIRPSMVKVEADSGLANTVSLNSLEIVAISHKPKKTFLSKNLIALLHYNGVPKEYFLDLLTNALEDSQRVYTDKRAALRVALNHWQIDDNFTAARMILSGVNLNEPYLQHCLSYLGNEERKGLKGGKLPISESFYLMGTADPTGVLNNDEVCVIVDNGHISGKVLVYRNPGLHFGDIHVLNAKYVKALDDIVGNSKYAIFFSTKGPRSVANEIANGDFDGDMYWVSRNPQLLHYFKPSEPWERRYSTPKAHNRRPTEFSHEELEQQLFQLFLKSREPSYSMGVAADSWLAFMDRLLILGDGSASEKDSMKEKMHRLIDIYYDALDAPKTGKKVEVPDDLKADLYPHYMGRVNSYHSKSVLGLIHDKVDLPQTEEMSVGEIWKLPCFEDVIPEKCLSSWGERYTKYRHEMVEALNPCHESKNDNANEVIKKYKQLLYGAPEFEESARTAEEIYKEALAIYHVTYDYALSQKDVRKCGFAWKVAGSALCKLYAANQGERSMVCLPSVLREVFR